MDGRITQTTDTDAVEDEIKRRGNDVILDELPPANTKRWVASRKAAVVTAVKAGLITIDEVCVRYNLSVEEFLSWQEKIEKHGVRALHVTKLQDFRRS